MIGQFPQLDIAGGIPPLFASFAFGDFATSAGGSYTYTTSLPFYNSIYQGSGLAVVFAHFYDASAVTMTNCNIDGNIATELVSVGGGKNRGIYVYAYPFSDLYIGNSKSIELTWGGTATIDELTIYSAVVISKSTATPDDTLSVNTSGTTATGTVDFARGSCVLASAIHQADTTAFTGLYNLAIQGEGDIGSNRLILGINNNIGTATTGVTIGSEHPSSGTHRFVAVVYNP